jgi:hypothetical protein
MRQSLRMSRQSKQRLAPRVPRRPSEAAQAMHPKNGGAVGGAMSGGFGARLDVFAPGFTALLAKSRCSNASSVSSGRRGLVGPRFGRSFEVVLDRAARRPPACAPSPGRSQRQGAAVAPTAIAAWSAFSWPAFRPPRRPMGAAASVAEPAGKR